MLTVEAEVKVCPKCGRENPVDTPICSCGQLLTDVQRSVGTVQYDDTDYEDGTPKWGSARYSKTLMLQVLDTKETFTFELEPNDEVIMGRVDPETDERPPVDLTSASGLEKGVSRKHAVIMRKDGSLHIMDNGSANGTFLNGQRLVANQPRILRDGDDIRLGHLVVRVTFSAGKLPGKPA